MSQSDSRIVALDTEKTGTSNEDKIVEIACVEVIDRVIGKSWQTLINPVGKFQSALSESKA